MMLEIGFISVFLFCVGSFSSFLAWRVYCSQRKYRQAGEIELFMILFFTIIGLICFYNSYDQARPETRIQSELKEKKRKEQIEKDKIPHVIREVDGCKVYSFSDGSKWHYFTRCENSRTITAQKECHLVGKVNTCKEYFTSIETTTNK